MKQFKIFFVVFISIFVAFSGFAKTESISGIIYEVYPSDEEFTVSIEKPGTKTTSLIQIKVNPNTEYFGITNLGDLRLDQSVEIDFSQDENGFFMAKIIKVVSEPPQEETA